jgi:Phosphate-selective porin O and P
MRTSYLVNTIVFLLCCSLQSIAAAESLNAPPTQSSESEEVHRLNQKISAQAEQLAAQQAQINALQSSFAEQKALLLNILHPNAANPTSTVALPQPASAPSVTTSTSLPTVVAVTPVETIASPALKQEQKEEPFVKEPRQWFNKYSIRGYMQLRENNLINTNALYKCDQCDKSIGPGNTFFLRRMRLVLSGNVSDHISIYLQPDFASASGTSLNYAQLRDAYFDLSIDKEKENRFRVGQSKIPYGFEELQSSQNRLDFDRTDALNSAFANERDLGIFYYWARPAIRARFNELISLGLKGSGDYGELGAGFFNGQIVNTLEGNNDFHYVARYTYPFKLRNGQLIETSIQGYTGKYKVTSLSPTTKGIPGLNYLDQRIAGSLIIYPQPLGLQTEYNWGTGPEYNPATKYIDQKNLNGGYALLNYRQVLPRSLVVYPYFRFQYYSGGKKQELDARKYLVREGEIGIEAEFGKYFEPTLQYQYGDRTFEDGAKPNNREKGSLLRLQLQFNY